MAPALRRRSGELVGRAAPVPPSEYATPAPSQRLVHTAPLIEPRPPPGPPLPPSPPRRGPRTVRDRARSVQRRWPVWSELGEAIDDTSARWAWPSGCDTPDAYCAPDPRVPPERGHPAASTRTTRARRFTQRWRRDGGGAADGAADDAAAAAAAVAARLAAPLPPPRPSTRRRPRRDAIPLHAALAAASFQRLPVTRRPLRARTAVARRAARRCRARGRARAPPPPTPRPTPPRLPAGRRSRRRLRARCASLPLTCRPSLSRDQGERRQTSRAGTSTTRPRPTPSAPSGLAAPSRLRRRLRTEARTRGTCLWSTRARSVAPMAALIRRSRRRTARAPRFGGGHVLLLFLVGLCCTPP